MSDYLDDDGYPTEEALQKIKGWPYSNGFTELMEFIKPLWRWRTLINSSINLRKEEWTLNTGGWSGNEDIIASLQSNHIFWLICWMSSHRGGRHVFNFSPCASQGKK